MMGLQLIFVVEADRKCKSDWIYVKDTIDKFYQYDRTNVKFSPVYMNGKGNYKSKDREIKKLISQYKVGGKTNKSAVIYCFDCDDYDSKPDDANFLSKAKYYCEQNGYEFAWFCKDVERVYLGEKVDNSQKKKRSAMFKANCLIDLVDSQKLQTPNYRPNSSNIMLVIGKYLTSK